MDQPPQIVRLKHPWRSSHPWIFQRLVEKPDDRPRPGSVVEVRGEDDAWIGRGFYNGHARVALRLLETDPEVAVDAAWFARKIADAVRLRRDILRLDEATDAWRVVHSEGDGLSGLVVDRYADLLVVEFFSAGMHRHREWIFDALRAQFPGCRFHAFADRHVQKQESFDCRPFNSEGVEPVAPVVIHEHGVRFRADPAAAHKTGFFTDQRDNREWLSRLCAGQRVLDLCCNTGGFGIHAAARGAKSVLGVDIDADVLGIARANAELNDVDVAFEQAEVHAWLRDAAARGETYDVVVLDPAKMTRAREKVVPALKKYLELNRLALAMVAPGGLFATFSCTGLVTEEQFLDTLRRAAYQANRTLQVIRVAGAGPDHPFHAHVHEPRYLKAVFCRVLD
ncbi:class I SAM-dependent rRNA methyltransferase [Luteimonas vadosa]|uniref:Class I SAM-dependent rRNA methyltransferase n=1 Tax=Luteimonas vadosa TaxID=1165507 RepID=A0ABP9DWC0_9GAMM